MLTSVSHGTIYGHVYLWARRGEREAERTGWKKKNEENYFRVTRIANVLNNESCIHTLGFSKHLIVI